jgi:hypothetical protein
MPDSEIDFSDIPEATDKELKRMRRVGRPSSGMAKQLIAIRLSVFIAENGSQARQAVLNVHTRAARESGVPSGMSIVKRFQNSIRVKKSVVILRHSDVEIRLPFRLGIKR